MGRGREGSCPPPAPTHPVFLPSLLLPASLSFSCLLSPNVRRLLSWVLSHPTHRLPQHPCPSQPQGPPHQAPCRPRLMEARWLPVTQPWPVGTQASHLPMPCTGPCSPSRHKRWWPLGMGGGQQGWALKALSPVRQWHPALSMPEGHSEAPPDPRPGLCPSVHRNQNQTGK